MFFFPNVLFLYNYFSCFLFINLHLAKFPTFGKLSCLARQHLRTVAARLTNSLFTSLHVFTRLALRLFHKFPNHAILPDLRSVDHTQSRMPDLHSMDHTQSRLPDSRSQPPVHPSFRRASRTLTRPHVHPRLRMNHPSHLCTTHPSPLERLHLNSFTRVAT